MQFEINRKFSDDVRVVHLIWILNMTSLHFECNIGGATIELTFWS